MQCCRKSATSLVLTAIQGKLTNLSRQNLTYPLQRKEEKKGKKQNKRKPKQTKTPKTTTTAKRLAKVTTLMIPKTFETFKAHT